MITILTVNYNSNDFIELMLSSVKDTYVVVVENSRSPRKIKGKHKLIRNLGEKSHGEGLNLGLAAVDSPLVLILDADCHILSPNWKWKFQEKTGGSLKNNIPGIDCYTIQGPPQKPIRPACVFMKTGIARQLDWRATPGYMGHRKTPDGFDVGIKAYHQLKEWGFEVNFMDIKKPNRYDTLNGEEYCIDGEPMVYHHWHGTHLVERAHDYPGQDLISDKQKLFNQFKKPKTFL